MRVTSREAVGDARRLLSSAECKHVTHRSECRENTQLRVSCHAYGQKSTAFRAQLIWHAVVTLRASREDGKSLHALPFINIYHS